MGATKTTWKKGERPPVQKPKGRKNNRTLLKEMIGIKGWEDAQNYLSTTGISKALTELETLRGKDFVNGIAMLTEFYKPKLARTETLVKADVNITWGEIKQYAPPPGSLPPKEVSQNGNGH